MSVRYTYNELACVIEIASRMSFVGGSMTTFKRQFVALICIFLIFTTGLLAGTVFKNLRLPVPVPAEARGGTPVSDGYTQTSRESGVAPKQENHEQVDSGPKPA